MPRLGSIPSAGRHSGPGVASDWIAASTSPQNSAPRPTRCCSYQSCACAISSSASASMRRSLVIAVGRELRAVLWRPPKEHRRRARRRLAALDALALPSTPNQGAHSPRAVPPDPCAPVRKAPSLPETPAGRDSSSGKDSREGRPLPRGEWKARVSKVSQRCEARPRWVWGRASRRPASSRSSSTSAWRPPRHHRVVATRPSCRCRRSKELDERGDHSLFV